MHFLLQYYSTSTFDPHIAKKLLTLLEVHFMSDSLRLGWAYGWFTCRPTYTSTPLLNLSITRMFVSDILTITQFICVTFPFTKVRFVYFLHTVGCQASYDRVRAGALVAVCSDGQ